MVMMGHIMVIDQIGTTISQAGTKATTEIRAEMRVTTETMVGIRETTLQEMKEEIREITHREMFRTTTHKVESRPHTKAMTATEIIAIANNRTIIGAKLAITNQEETIKDIRIISQGGEIMTNLTIGIEDRKNLESLTEDNITKRLGLESEKSRSKRSLHTTIART